MSDIENGRVKLPTDAEIQKAGAIAIDSLALETSDIIELVGKAASLDYGLEIIARSPGLGFNLNNAELRERITRGSPQDRFELVRTMQESDTIYISASALQKDL